MAHLSIRAASVHAAYRRIVQDNKESDGAYDISFGSPIHVQLADWLRNNPEDPDVDQAAYQFILKDDKNRRKKNTSKQGELFVPDEPLVISQKGGRVEKGEAKGYHLDAWYWDVRKPANDRENTDFAQDTALYEQHRPLFATPDTTWLDVVEANFPELLVQQSKADCEQEQEECD